MSHKLILADDSITIQKVVELILAEENFEIKSTNNGEEALAAIPSFQPNVVLADIEMPKMNGYQLCEKIKQDPSSQGISVILLAGAFEPIDEELAKQVKADDYIVKPFESQELLSKINAVLTASPVTEVEAEEEPVEVAAVESDETQLEEDLWAMEEIPEAAEVTAVPEEEVTAGTEEMAELAESLEAEPEPEMPIAVEEPPPQEEAEPVAEKAPAPAPDVSMLSNDEMKRIFEDAVNTKMTSLVSSLDIKEAILSSLTPLVKESVEKVIWEVVPDITEKMLKEMLKGSLESLTKEVEKVIWETVPDLAETMISKEIERIRSEF
jgi:DNA-binding response OmpR family regulator